jgi:hypothetical protein
LTVDFIEPVVVELHEVRDLQHDTLRELNRIILGDIDRLFKQIQSEVEGKDRSRVLGGSLLKLVRDMQKTRLEDLHRRISSGRTSVSIVNNARRIGSQSRSGRSPQTAEPTIPNTGRPPESFYRPTPTEEPLDVVISDIPASSPQQSRHAMLSGMSSRHQQSFPSTSSSSGSSQPRHSIAQPTSHPYNIERHPSSVLGGSTPFQGIEHPPNTRPRSTLEENSTWMSYDPTQYPRRSSLKAAHRSIHNSDQHRSAMG